MKSGFAVLAGRSNVGKSTLLNALVGTKIAITSPKPQTTRFPIQGVVNNERGQIVFVDTPGIFEKAHEVITQTLNRRAREALREIDLLIYVTDPTRPIGHEEKMLLRLIEPLTVGKILVINKIDEPQKPFLEEYQNLAPSFNAQVEISALHQQNLKPLLALAFELLPEGEPIYPEGQFTNLENRVWLAEIIREKIFQQMGQEIPYQTTVEIKEIQERGQDKNGALYLQADLITNQIRHRGMLVGRGGQKIKEIGQAARRELEIALNRKVFLELKVVVDPDWPSRLL